jgi:cytochrome c oxidase subunit 2
VNEEPPFRLLPERGSALAGLVDDLTLLAVLIAAFFSLLIAGLLLYFGVKYRRRDPAQVGITATKPTATLEVVWSVIPLGIVLYLFYAGAEVYFALARPPADAVELYVVGKQWMWKIQHPDGRREINELHVPVGQAVKLTMISEDVIHSFYVPAFRTKTDVLPGRYTTVWFRADRIGTFHLFCAEYCGTEHSKMTGRVIVMEPHGYEEWLGGSRPQRSTAEAGEELFTTRGCTTCHRPDSAARAPILQNLASKPVRLADGQTITADPTYIRESILRPAAKVVAGYQPIMPSYQGQFTEDELTQLVSYLTSPRAGGGAGTGGGVSGGVTAGDAGAAEGGQER